MAKKKSHKETLHILDSVKKKVKNSDVYKKLCKEIGVEEDIIFLIPMAFVDLEVSARTEKGCIYFNYDLLDNFEKSDHYMMHELTHWAQQCFGDGPTARLSKDNYLDDKCEKEGFRAQTEYLSETRDDDAAKKYINKVLDHHKVYDAQDREGRTEDLLNLAAIIASKTNSIA